MVENRNCDFALEGGVSLLVGADTGGLEGFRTQLLVLVRHHVDAQRELIDVGALAAQVEDADLRVGDTTVEAGLGVRLERRCQYRFRKNPIAIPHIIVPPQESRDIFHH